MAVAIETRTDAQIQSDVLAELKWDARVMPNEIGCQGWSRHVDGLGGFLQQALGR
jgi:hypothetical protein